jgi:hypothetical protein
LQLLAAAHRGIPRAVWHTIGLIVAALLAYAIWRAYQNPDFLLEYGAYMLC